MSDNYQENEPKYGVFLGKDQHLSVIEKRENEDIFNLARRALGCEWIEIVDLNTDHAKDCVLLINEEGKLNSDRIYVNCVASYLYESHKHGDMIAGSALLVKSGEEGLRLLTRSEASALTKELISIRKTAVLETVSGVNEMTRKEHMQRAAESILDFLRKTPEQPHKSSKNRTDGIER